MAAELTADILHRILHFVREQYGLRSLSSCLKVNRYWRSIASPLLWAHVVLNNDGLASLVRNNKDNPKSLATIRSVTLRIEAILDLRLDDDDSLKESYRQQGHPRTQALHADLGSFSQSILPNARHMKTFSVFVTYPPFLPDPEVDLDDQFDDRLASGFRLDTAVLGQLLRALPTSCTNLELDTDGADWSPSSRPHHICSDLCILLPRMRHVKLRVHTLCSRLLLVDQSDPDLRTPELDFSTLDASSLSKLAYASNLETLSICTVPRCKHGLAFVQCSDAQAHIDRGKTEPWPKPGGLSNGKSTLLFSNLSIARKRGCFPSALVLDVVQLRTHRPLPGPRPPGSRAERAVVYRNTIHVRDYVEDVMYPLPIHTLGDGMDVLYDRTDTCCIGKPAQLLRHAEHAVWKDVAAYGARLPARGVSDIRFLESQPFLSRTEYQQTSAFAMIGWRKQEDEADATHVERVIRFPGADAEFDIEKMPLLLGERFSGARVSGLCDTVEHYLE